jgi:Fur family peroxide stress response transcriptional regulator
VQRYSRKREAILTALRGTTEHPTADWLYARVKPEIPDLSLATVYRNLSAFVEEGLAMVVGTVDGQERYDGNVLPHAHFVCRSCGRVLDLGCDAAAELDRAAEEATGCRVESHRLTFFGRCTKCEKA